MAQLKIRRRGYALGAEVTGFDGRKPLDPETIAGIRQAWLDHIMLVLPGQDLNAVEFRNFCRQFGELDFDNIATLPHHPEMAEVVVRANQPIAMDGSDTLGKSPPADVWHSDFSHKERSSTISFLLAKAIPSVGGDTMFANMYTAYETLSPGMQRLLEPLSAVYDTVRRAGNYSAVPRGPMADDSLKSDIVHPVVRVHPDTGRKALFLTERTRNFVGMTEEETKPLLDYLYGQHATRYEFVYRHRWAVNDLVLWDNRCSLHVAVQDYDPELRLMLRCSLQGPKVGRVYTAEDRKLAAASN